MVICFATRMILCLSVVISLTGCSSLISGRQGLLAKGASRTVPHPGEIADCLLERNEDPSLCSTAGWIWPDHCGCQHPINYVPREGDVVLMSSRNPLYTFLYALGGAGHPLHMGMIVRTSGGELAILESGGSEDKRVSIRPVQERLIEYLGSAKDVAIWVRPVMGPLHDYQSAQLTCFAPR